VPGLTTNQFLDDGDDNDNDAGEEEEEEHFPYLTLLSGWAAKI